MLPKHHTSQPRDGTGCGREREDGEYQCESRKESLHPKREQCLKRRRNGRTPPAFRPRLEEHSIAPKLPSKELIYSCIYLARFVIEDEDTEMTIESNELPRRKGGDVSGACSTPFTAKTIELTEVSSVATALSVIVSPLMTVAPALGEVMLTVGGGLGITILCSG